MQIWLIDRDEKLHTRSLARRTSTTTHPEHLLNAPAGKMSGLPGAPDHLVEWASETGGRPVTGSAFLPRRVYGTYLRDTLARAEHSAQPAGRLARISAEVTAIRPGAGGRAARLHLSAGHLDADVVILATGSAPARLPFGAPDCDRIVADPWLPGALRDVLADTGGNDVVVVGTGLTMVDLANAITDARPGSRMHAVSRHGLVPRAHPADGSGPARPMWLPVITRTTGEVRLADLMWQVRSAMTAGNGSWHAVMESLRPYVPGLWRRLPDEDKRLFLRHLSTATCANVQRRHAHATTRTATAMPRITTLPSQTGRARRAPRSGVLGAAAAWPRWQSCSRSAPPGQ